LSCYICKPSFLSFRGSRGAQIDQDAPNHWPRDYVDWEVVGGPVLNEASIISEAKLAKLLQGRDIGLW